MKPTAEQLKDMAGKGTLYQGHVGGPGLLRPAKIVELAAYGDHRRWLAILEASGIILRAEVLITEREAMAEGHLPSFWARKWRDAFNDMLIEAQKVEMGDEPKTETFDAKNLGAIKSV